MIFNTGLTHLGSEASNYVFELFDKLDKFLREIFLKMNKIQYPQ